MDIKNLPEVEKKKIELLKSVFAGEKDLLKTLRKIILGLPLSKEEQERKSLITDNKEIIEYLSQVLNPTLKGDEEIFMINDLWFQLNVKDKPIEEAILLMNAVRQNELFMIEGIKRLKGEVGTRAITDYVFDDSKSDKDNLLTMITRNIIISGVEGTLRGIFHLAGEKGETLEQLAERMAKNSSK